MAPKSTILAEEQRIYGDFGKTAKRAALDAVRRVDSSCFFRVCTASTVRSVARVSLVGRLREDAGPRLGVGTHLLRLLLAVQYSEKKREHSEKMVAPLSKLVGYHLEWH